MGELTRRGLGHNHELAVRTGKREAILEKRASGCPIANRCAGLLLEEKSRKRKI